MVAIYHRIHKTHWGMTKWRSLSRRHNQFHFLDSHYSDVVMSTTASEITGISIVCSTVCSGEDQRKHQSSSSLAFVKGIHVEANGGFPSQRASNAENVSI